MRESWFEESGSSPDVRETQLEVKSRALVRLRRRSIPDTAGLNWVMDTRISATNASGKPGALPSNVHIKSVLFFPIRRTRRW